MSERETLRLEFEDPEYKYGYVESHLDSAIAIQLFRRRRGLGLTQAEVGARVGTTQSGVARHEDVNYRGWNVETLKRYARALGLNLVVKFVTDEQMLDELEAFDAELSRAVGSGARPRAGEGETQK